jgi:hypothetical protein
MKLFPILAVLLASATPASASFHTNWLCGQVMVEITTSKDWKGGTLERPIRSYSISFEKKGLPDEEIKPITIRFRIVHDEFYVNGRRCEQISDEEAEKWRNF